MKTKMKALTLVLCAVMLVATTVFATVAYLTSQTGVVTNTFSVGNVKITLDEAPVDVYGDVVAGARVTENTYKLIPGHSYTKDPIVHVTKGSEKCWLFVQVVDEIANIEDAITVVDQMAANKWIALGNNVYYYKDTVDAREAAIDVKVFETFTIKGDADVAAYESKKITVQAYAIQADGFDSAAAAWAAAPTDWN